MCFLCVLVVYLRFLRRYTYCFGEVLYYLVWCWVGERFELASVVLGGWCVGWCVLCGMFELGCAVCVCGWMLLVLVQGVVFRWGCGVWFALDWFSGCFTSWYGWVEEVVKHCCFFAVGVCFWLGLCAFDSVSFVT